MVPRPISTRKLDILYLTFFILHIFIILNVDLVSLYPLSITPEYMLAIRKYYIETYKDRFFASPPGWFRWYLRVEGVYHLPLSAWAAWGIVRGKFLKRRSIRFFVLRRSEQALECSQCCCSSVTIPMSAFTFSLSVLIICRRSHCPTPASRLGCPDSCNDGDMRGRLCWLGRCYETGEICTCTALCAIFGI